MSGGVLFLGAMRYAGITEKNAKPFPTGAAVVLGQVTSMPELNSSTNGRFYWSFRMDCFQVKDAQGKWQKMEGALKSTLPAPTSITPQYGDVLLLPGEILEIKSAMNPGQFDAESYWMRQGVSARFLARENGVRVDSNRGSWWIKNLFRLKKNLLNQIDRYVPYPENTVAKAITLGDRQGIPWDLRDAFVKSGTMHIIAISGSNVGLIAWILTALLGLFRIRRPWTYGITIVFLIAYCFMTGMDASVVRSTIMINLFLLGMILRRESELLTSLSWAAILILWFKPLEIFNAAFQLSFITVLAFATLLNTSLEKSLQEISNQKSSRTVLFFKRILKSWWLMIQLSLVAWFANLPLIAFYFYLCSPISILANMLIVPLASIQLTCAFAFLTLSSFFGNILGSALWGCTYLMNEISRFFAAVPLGSFRVSAPSIFDFILYYGVIVAWILRKKFRWNMVWFILICFIAGNLFVWKSFFQEENHDLRVTFLDVGHGDSICLQLPSGSTFLVDTGDRTSIDQGRFTIAPFLWSQGIMRLDGVIITHPHKDHYGGLPYLLTEFPVEKFYFMGLKRGMHFEKEGVKLDVLYPTDQELQNFSLDPNERSSVVRVQYGKRVFLLTGDAEGEAMEQLIQYGSYLKSDVLKVPHHGSRQSPAGEEFFSIVNPEIAVITEAERNQFFLPSSKTVDALKRLGAQIYQTGIVGAVQISTDGKDLKVKTMVNGREGMNPSPTGKKQ